jgi:hypothetical protein
VILTWPWAVISTDEASRIGWLTADQIVEHMDPAHAVRVTDALSDGPVTRAHHGIDVLA